MFRCSLAFSLSDNTSPALASPVNPKPRIPSLLRQRGRVQFPAGTLKRRVARNVAVATSRESGAQHLAAWLQPADGDHKSPLAANGDLKFARRAAILTGDRTSEWILLKIPSTRIFSKIHYCPTLHGRNQSIGSWSQASSFSLIVENGREPKNPRRADRGDGWTVWIT